MALPTRKTLTATLAAKGETLRALQGAKSIAAESFVTAAQEARDDSDRAGQQAAAVERAVAILEQAGVTL